MKNYFVFLEYQSEENPTRREVACKVTPMQTRNLGD